MTVAWLADKLNDQQAYARIEKFQKPCKYKLSNVIVGCCAAWSLTPPNTSTSNCLIQVFSLVWFVLVSFGLQRIILSPGQVRVDITTLICGQRFFLVCFTNMIRPHTRAYRGTRAYVGVRNGELSLFKAFKKILIVVVLILTTLNSHHSKPTTVLFSRQE